MILMCAVHRLSYTLNLYAHNSIRKLLMKVSFFMKKYLEFECALCGSHPASLGFGYGSLNKKKSGQSAQYYLGYSLPKKSSKKLGLIFDFKRQNKAHSKMCAEYVEIIS